MELFGWVLFVDVCGEFQLKLMSPHGKRILIR